MADKSTLMRMVNLADELRERTKSGRIAWKETDDPTVFLYSGSSSSVEVDSWVTSGRPRVALRLRNSSGAEVDALNLTYENDFATPGNESAFELLEELHELARRSALNVDEVIDSLLRDLESD